MPLLNMMDIFDYLLIEDLHQECLEKEECKEKEQLQGEHVLRLQKIWKKKTLEVIMKGLPKLKKVEQPIKEVEEGQQDETKDTEWTTVDRRRTRQKF